MKGSFILLLLLFVLLGCVVETTVNQEQRFDTTQRYDTIRYDRIREDRRREEATQRYVPDNLYISSKTIESLQVNNSLYNVTMRYDCADDLTLEKCLINSWNAPIQYSLREGYWNLYLEPYSCLGIPGPLGPMGPLSSIGPLGVNASVTKYLSGFLNGTCDWCEVMAEYIEAKWANYYNETSAEVVLGPTGALGYTGPLSQYQIYSIMYHLLEVPYLANDFSFNLDIYGIWGILGPLGPLGAFGPLGPLGPLLQRYQYNTIDPITKQYDGQYRDYSTGQIIRNLVMDFDYKGTMRNYELYEFYTSDTALHLGIDNQNDCSFAVQHYFNNTAEEVTYQFRSNRNQSISILLLPNLSLHPSPSDDYLYNFLFDNDNNYDNYYDNDEEEFYRPIANETISDFDFEILKKNEESNVYESLFTSNSTSSTVIYPIKEYLNYKGYVDFAIFRGEKGDDFAVKITSSHVDLINNQYRLYVTGSGFLEGPDGSLEDPNSFNHWNIFGSHQHFFLSSSH